MGNRQKPSPALTQMIKKMKGPSFIEIKLATHRLSTNIENQYKIVKNISDEPLSEKDSSVDLDLSPFELQEHNIDENIEKAFKKEKPVSEEDLEDTLQHLKNSSLKQTNLQDKMPNSSIKKK